MPIDRPTAAARRLLVVVAVAVAALLLAPVAGVVPGAGTGAASEAAAPQGTTSQPVGAAHVEAAKTSRRAKARKARKARRAAAATRADAVSSGPAAWTGSTLRYYDGLPAEWDWSLQTAVDQWNASGVKLTLVPVSSPSQAQVRISYGSIGGNSGLATVGRTTGAFVKLSDRYGSALGDEYDRVEVAGVLTHELGHVLGLEHTTRSCALMGTVMDIVGCGIYDLAQPEVYRCALVDPTAVAAAVRMYGGSARAQAAGTCPVPAAAA